MSTGLHCFARRPAATALVALLAACGDLTSTGPVAENQYEWFGVGNGVSCGIRGGLTSCTERYAPLDTLAPIAGPAEARELVFGYFHTCALASDGTAWCWGNAPQVGRPSGETAVPAPVSGEQRFSSLSGSLWRTCGLATDGSVWCWGYGETGPLFGWSTPRGEFCASEFECLLPTPMPTELRFSDLGIGLDHGCGLTSAGVPWCWGLNTSGQLGNGQVANAGSCEVTPCRSAPAEVATTTRFEQLAVTEAGACGLTPGGEAWCWGGGEGQPVRVSDHRFTTLTGGTQVCGLDAANTAWCWVPGAAPVPQRVPSLLFERIFPSHAWRGCGWNRVTGAACWEGLDGEPAIVPGQM